MDIKTLREQFATIHAAAGVVISEASKANRPLTAEEKAAQDKRYADMDAIQAQIDEQLKFAKYAIDKGTDKGIQLPANPPGKKEFEDSDPNRALFAADGTLDKLKFAKALTHYAQTGIIPREMAALFATTTSTGSGAYLPKEVGLPVAVRRLSNCFRNAIAAYGYEPIVLGSTAGFSLPIGDDTANSGQSLSESATSSTVLDETDASLSISPTLYDSKQKWFSNTMILANLFNVMDYVVPLLQKRIEKIQESAWTTTLKTLTVGKTLAATTAITYAELLAWEHSLAPAYRTDSCFIVADGLYQALRGLADDQHRPIFDLDPTNVFVGKIHGKPVIINDAMDAMTANKKSGAFLSADAIKIVDCNDQRIIVYVNYPEKPDQKGFQIVQNGDAKFVSSGVSLLATAIS